MAGMAENVLWAFTDGACTKNGKPGARASYAAIIGTSKNFEESLVIKESGLVLDNLYELDLTTHTGKAIENTMIAASNNRGELLGIITALSKMYSVRSAAHNTCRIVSDSRISICTLLEWLPNRRAKNTTDKLKNMDLLTIAETLLSRLREVCTVEIIHVNSHQPEPAEDAPWPVQLLWKGNNLADIEATTVLNVDS